MKNRTTVITGAGSGIGAAVADLLRSRGERVVGVDLKNSDLIADLSQQAERDQVAKKIRARGLAGKISGEGVRWVSNN